jgi:hypothetical protein
MVEIFARDRAGEAGLSAVCRAFFPSGMKNETIYLSVVLGARKVKKRECVMGMGGIEEIKKSVQAELGRKFCVPKCNLG